MRRTIKLPGEDERVKAFATRLTRLMAAKSWTGADLAREASKHMPRGKEMGRHLPSAYMRGLNYPNDVNLEAIAKALGVPKLDLVPESAMLDGGVPNFVNVSSTGSGMARLTIDTEIDEDSAMKIMKLVREGQRKKGAA